MQLDAKVLPAYKGRLSGKSWRLAPIERRIEAEIAPSQNVGPSQSGEVEHELSSKSFGKLSSLMMET
jgi:hypothetical protein